MFQTAIQAVAFLEYPTANPTHQNLHPFDVPCINCETSAQAESPASEYCKALMTKIFSLTNLQLMPFFKYQCKRLENPAAWLTSLETLLQNNFHLFTTWPMRMKLEMIMMNATIMYHEVATSQLRSVKKYDIALVKANLRTFKTSIEQLDYLYELKTEFLQDKFKIIDCSEIPFDQLIMIEIEKIEQYRASIEKIKGKKALSKNNLSDQYIDNQEFILKMNISKRTAQLWRDQALINYYQIGSKIYYKLSDVELMLQKNYNKPFKK